MKPYVGEYIPDDVLKQIVAETVNFRFSFGERSTDIFFT